MTTATAALSTGTWTIDPVHSAVGFSVRHLMVSKVRGEFETFSGTITVDADGAASVRAETKTRTGTAKVLFCCETTDTSSVAWYGSTCSRMPVLLQDRVVIAPSAAVEEMLPAMGSATSHEGTAPMLHVVLASPDPTPVRRISTRSVRQSEAGFVSRSMTESAAAASMLVL